MGRPAKNTNTKTGAIRKEETEKRAKTEEQLKGNDNKIKPNKEILNDRQMQIFEYILEELKASKLLGNLDVFILNQSAICIERLEKIDYMMNMETDFFLNAELRKSKDMYMKQFFRCCNELCLSPQARAKFAISNIPKDDKKKTLSEILGDDDD